MKILFLASGSGGHIYPSLALIDRLITKHQIGYVVIKNSMEERIIKDKRINKIQLDIVSKGHYYKKKPYKCIDLMKKTLYLAKIIKKYDLVFSFGGFVSVIASIGCFIAKKPLYIHEQNRIIGDGNKFALSFAKKIFTVYDDIEIKKKYQSIVKVVGNPRGEVASQYKSNYICRTPFKVLFLAGSLGSSTLLKKMKNVINSLLKENIEFTIITGNNLYDEFKSSFDYKNVKVVAYENNILTLMAKSSLVILRGGATSIEEVISLNVPSIVIPSPYVKHNHQEYNASYYHEKNALIMIKENEIEEKLAKTILKIKNNEFLYYTLIENMNKLNKNQAITLIEKEIDNEQ